MGGIRKLVPAFLRGGLKCGETGWPAWLIPEGWSYQQMGFSIQLSEPWWSALSIAPVCLPVEGQSLQPGKYQTIVGHPVGYISKITHLPNRRLPLCVLTGLQSES